MPNYQNSRIYKIVCNKTDLEFIDTTTLPLSQRLAQHKDELKRFINGTNRHYCDSYKVMENNDFEIILLEKYPCTSKEELNARKRLWTANN